MTACVRDLHVIPMAKSDAAYICKTQHYLRRRPPMSFAVGLFDAELFGRLLGVVTFGVPASRHLMMSACRTHPEFVLELNRLWVHDDCARNTESFFVSRALRTLPPRIIVSYADSAYGHRGYIYRALSFKYAGTTDMDRKTPRFDYITPGKHSRDTSRNGSASTATKIRRLPKYRYWTVTGTRAEKRRLFRLVTWPSLAWCDTRNDTMQSVDIGE